MPWEARSEIWDLNMASKASEWIMGWRDSESCMFNSESPMKIVMQGLMHGLGESEGWLGESTRVFPTFGHAWTWGVAGNLTSQWGDFTTTWFLEGLDDSVTALDESGQHGVLTLIVDFDLDQGLAIWLMGHFGRLEIYEYGFVMNIGGGVCGGDPRVWAYPLSR